MSDIFLRGLRLKFTAAMAGKRQSGINKWTNEGHVLNSYLSTSFSGPSRPLTDKHFIQKHHRKLNMYTLLKKKKKNESHVQVSLTIVILMTFFLSLFPPVFRPHFMLLLSLWSCGQKYYNIIF